MGKKGVRANVSQTRPLIAATRPIPRDRDNTDDLVEAELRVHTKASPFLHPGKKVRKGSFEGNTSAPQGPNNAVVKP